MISKDTKQLIIRPAIFAFMGFLIFVSLRIIKVLIKNQKPDVIDMIIAGLIVFIIIFFMSRYNFKKRMLQQDKDK